MTDLKAQEKLTDGKGWKGIDFSREKPFSIVPGTVKKVSEKIQKIKDKKKRGPREE